jgi:hypothetical protein
VRGVLQDHLVAQLPEPRPEIDPHGQLAVAVGADVFEGAPRLFFFFQAEPVGQGRVHQFPQQGGLGGLEVGEVRQQVRAGLEMQRREVLPPALVVVAGLP